MLRIVCIIFNFQVRTANFVLDSTMYSMSFILYRKGTSDVPAFLHLLENDQNARKRNRLHFLRKDAIQLRLYSCLWYRVAAIISDWRRQVGHPRIALKFWLCCGPGISSGVAPCRRSCADHLLLGLRGLLRRRLLRRDDDHDDDEHLLPLPLLLLHLA